MATNGSTHKFNKNDNNWLHKHFEAQQVDVVVSSISILGLSAFPQTYPLKMNIIPSKEHMGRMLKGYNACMNY